MGKPSHIEVHQKRRINKNDREQVMNASYDLIKTFMKKYKKSDIMEKLMDKRQYTKPSEKRRMKNIQRKRMLDNLRREREKDLL